MCRERSMYHEVAIEFLSEVCLFGGIYTNRRNWKLVVARLATFRRANASFSFRQREVDTSTPVSLSLPPSPLATLALTHGLRTTLGA